MAIEECLALGLDGVMGIVADSKGYCKRTVGLCLEKRVGLITLVPRTCAIRQELEGLGAAAAHVASLGGETWTHQARDAATMARAKCHPAGGRGV